VRLVWHKAAMQQPSLIRRGHMQMHLSKQHLLARDYIVSQRDRRKMTNLQL